MVDPANGLGFVVADHGGPDILLHLIVFRNFGQSAVADGSAIVVEVTHTARGLRAVAVLSIAPTEASPGTTLPFELFCPSSPTSPPRSWRAGPWSPKG